MSLSSEQTTRVLAIGDFTATHEQIIAAISSQKEFELVQIIQTSDKLAREVHAAEPHIILVDTVLAKEPTIDIIDDLSLQFSDAAIVAILASEDPVAAQQVTLAGARAFIIQPFTQINLLSTLRRVRDLEDRRRHFLPAKSAQATADQPMHTVAIYSPRGGAGVSTLALNLALAAKDLTRRRVLLIEGKLFFGHIDLMLNIRGHNTLTDLIPHASQLDERLVQDVIIKHTSGLNVLLAPSSIQIAQGIRPDDLYKVVVGLQKMYDLVVIDAGSALTENTVTLLDLADHIVAVATPELAAIHDIGRFIQITRSLAYNPEKLMHVVNRAGMPGGIKRSDIETALHNRVFAEIPNDEANATRSLNRGIPLLVRYPRSPASRAIRQLSDQLFAPLSAELARKPQAAASEQTVAETAVAANRVG